MAREVLGTVTSGTDLVVRGADLVPGLQVLDLACGTGEPAFSIAKAVDPQGSVVANDLVPAMLQVARQFASERGLSNIEFQTADAEHLPFPDQRFDRITCRFGLMFFPDVQKALSEQCRVLRPNGRISFGVWGPADENPVFATVLGAFLKHVPVPPPPPDAPSVYRFADQARRHDPLCRFSRGADPQGQNWLGFGRGLPKKRGWLPKN